MLGADLVEGRRQLRVNRLDRGHPVLAPGDEFGDDEVPREDLHDERNVAQALELFREWSQAFRTGRKTDFRKTIGMPYGTGRKLVLDEMSSPLVGFLRKH